MGLVSGLPPGHLVVQIPPRRQRTAGGWPPGEIRQESRARSAERLRWQNPNWPKSPGGSPARRRRLRERCLEIATRGLDIARETRLNLQVEVRPGDVIDDKYRLIRKLGAGGMGMVFEAENLLIDRRVAIKILGESPSEGDAERLRFEARAVGRLGSKHIVSALDLGTLPDQSPYIVMEYLAGETLGERLRRLGRLSPEELGPIAAQLLDGLQAAHDAGIVHRDLKPDNVFLATEPHESCIVKLLDFGISKSLIASRRGANRTRDGVAIGTPHYMSPEQVRGQPVDPRTDLYSVGVMLFQCLSGTLPYSAPDYHAVFLEIVTGKAARLQELAPELSSAWVALVERAMARDPADRFQSAAEFRRELTVVSEPQRANRQETTPPPTGTRSTWSTVGRTAASPGRHSLFLVGVIATGLLLGSLGARALLAHLGHSGGTSPNAILPMTSALPVGPVGSPVGARPDHASALRGRSDGDVSSAKAEADPTPSISSSVAATGQAASDAEPAAAVARGVSAGVPNGSAPVRMARAASTSPATSTAKAFRNPNPPTAGGELAAPGGMTEESGVGAGAAHENGPQAPHTESGRQDDTAAARGANDGATEPSAIEARGEDRPPERRLGF